MRAHDVAAPPAHGDVELEPIARHHLTAELGVVHAAKPGTAGRSRRGRAVENQEACHLRERLDHEHARHERRAGKVALKEFLVDGDVLDRHDAAARLEQRDGVDEH